MKQKLTIGISLLVLIGLIILISWDFFYKSENKKGNTYEYTLDKLKQVDTNLLCYNESQYIVIDADSLTGIAVDSADNIYVCGGDKVFIFNNVGDTLGNFPIPQPAYCISIDSEGKIYLSYKNQIAIYSSSGELINQWDTINSSAYITSIAVGENSVFLADAGNKILHQYNFNGKLINKIGKRNKEKGIQGFFIPSPYFDVLIGRDGEIWAINTGRHAFEAYNEKGEQKSRWEKRSMGIDGFSGCCNPTHVAILSDGSFVTSEKGLERIKIHHANGELKCVVAKPNQFIKGTKGLDLAVDSKDQILVLDPEKKAVRIFEISK